MDPKKLPTTVLVALGLGTIPLTASVCACLKLADTSDSSDDGDSSADDSASDDSAASAEAVRARVLDAEVLPADVVERLTHE